MREAKDVLKIVIMIVLGFAVLAIAVPLVMAAAGIVIGFFVELAVMLIKLAVVVAIGYLVLVGIRALLR